MDGAVAFGLQIILSCVEMVGGVGDFLPGVQTAALAYACSMDKQNAYIYLTYQPEILAEIQNACAGTPERCLTQAFLS